MKTLFILFVFLVTATTWSQNGQISGKVLDEDTGEPIPFAVITLSIGDSLCYGANSDFDGLFRIVQIKPGQYDLKIRFIGYDEINKKVTIVLHQIKRMDIGLMTEAPCICIEDPVDGFRIPVMIGPESEVGATVKN